MPSIVCYQPELHLHDQPVWRRLADPKYLVRRQGTLVLELPAGGHYRGFVNGLEVLGGLQVVERGDLVRVVEPDGAETAYVVGRVLPSLQPGDGRSCQFTGKPIAGQAVVCPGCACLFALEVVEQIGRCPNCLEPLGHEEDLPPEEELW